MHAREPQTYVISQNVRICVTGQQAHGCMHVGTQDDTSTDLLEHYVIKTLQAQLSLPVALGCAPLYQFAVHYVCVAWV